MLQINVILKSTLFPIKLSILLLVSWKKQVLGRANMFSSNIFNHRKFYGAIQFYVPLESFAWCATLDLIKKIFVVKSKKYCPHTFIGTILNTLNCIGTYIKLSSYRYEYIWDTILTTLGFIATKWEVWQNSVLWSDCK